MAIKIIHRLPVDPFANWLSDRIEKVGKETFCDRIKEEPIWVSRVINRKFKTVDIDKADMILCRDGTTHLREIYPQIYEE